MGEQKKEKRILISALGVGSPKGQMDADEAFKQLQEHNYAYRTANYSYNKVDPDITENRETAFVGDALTYYYKPAEVLFIGTLSSMWTNLYFKAMNETNGEPCLEDFKTIYNIQSKKAINATENEIEADQEKIEKIFKKNKFKLNNATIHILITNYGMKEEELENNYKRIREKIRDELLSPVEGDINNISFDITHSFRSLPIYDLAALIYLRSISRREIKIEHVFYGNVEISGENNDVAAIVDIQSLVKVIDHSIGAQTFKKTGNANVLTDSMENGSKEKEALEEFDWATQINDYDKIEKNLRDYFGCGEINTDSSTNQSDSSIDNDAFIMSKKILNKAFPQPQERVDWQYHLSKWYFNQNRYGQAIATGLETLRSILQEVLCDNKYADRTKYSSKYNGVGYNYEDENTRKEAEGRVLYADKRLGPSEELSKEEKNFLEFSSIVDKAKNVRNMFAHVLSNSRKELKEDQDDKERKSINTEKESIKMFFERLDQLYKSRKENDEYWGTFKAIFLKDGARRTQNTGNNCKYIIIGKGKTIILEKEENKEKQNTKGTHFTVDIKCINKGNDEIKDQAEEIITDLKNKYNDKKIIIVMVNLTLTQAINFGIKLRNNGYEKVFFRDASNRARDKDQTQIIDNTPAPKIYINDNVSEYKEE